MKDAAGFPGVRGEANDSVGDGSREHGVMSGENYQGFLSAGQRVKKGYDCLGVCLVDCRGWFIGQYDVRPVDERSGNGRPLTLTARERVRLLVQLIIDAENPGKPGDIPARTRKVEREGNVLGYSQKRKQPSRLEYVADIAAAQVREQTVDPLRSPEVELTDVWKEHDELPGRRRRKHKPQNVKKCRFAASAGADHGYKFALKSPETGDGEAELRIPFAKFHTEVPDPDYFLPGHAFLTEAG